MHVQGTAAVLWLFGGGGAGGGEEGGHMVGKVGLKEAREGARGLHA